MSTPISTKSSSDIVRFTTQLPGNLPDLTVICQRGTHGNDGVFYYGIVSTDPERFEGYREGVNWKGEGQESHPEPVNYSYHGVATRFERAMGTHHTLLPLFGKREEKKFEGMDELEQTVLKIAQRVANQARRRD
jgi:hypothetical protein